MLTRTTVLIVAFVASSCSQSLPSGPTAAAPSASTGDGSARVSTQNMRDLPPVSIGTDCPSDKIGDFEMNVQSAAPNARVLPQGRRPTNKDTIVGYDIQWTRENDERAGDNEFGEFVRHEGVFSAFVVLLDEQPVYVQHAGTYYARGRHVCKGGKTGAWTYYNFGVDGARADATPTEPVCKNPFAATGACTAFTG